MLREVALRLRRFVTVLHPSPDKPRPLRRKYRQLIDREAIRKIIAEKRGDIPLIELMQVITR